MLAISAETESPNFTHYYFYLQTVGPSANSRVYVFNTNLSLLCFVPDLNNFRSLACSQDNSLCLNPLLYYPAFIPHYWRSRWKPQWKLFSLLYIQNQYLSLTLLKAGNCIQFFNTHKNSQYSLTISIYMCMKPFSRTWF